MAKERLKILYVEDNRVDQMAIKRMVREDGLPYDISSAGTIAEAVDLLEKEDFDIILLDYLLPDGTGFDLLGRIEKTPSIFITGSGDEIVAVNALKGGAYDYLIKAADGSHLNLLPATIEKVLKTCELKRKNRENEEKILRQNKELERLYKEARSLSLHDPLTELANRRLLDIEIERGIAMAKRYRSTFSIIMIDIDHFKRYNDTKGHIAGDKLLNRIAQLILKTTRGSDFAARYGGEEFIVLLPETGEVEACETAERIRRTIEEDGEVTISLGIASFRGGMEKEDLINASDRALYKAKEKGRNRAEIAGPD